uniref:Putative vitellogenin-1 isoform X2 n=1 Tax=Davidia involucrata TaxID=16924 RepID=A0A5B7CBC2_DAVIN
MARINCADEKRSHSNSNSIENEEEEEEEALSLCDLPNNEESQSRKEEAEAIETPEDFDFGLLGGSLLTESEICAADEVFFQGQILPLRHSISSDSGGGFLAGFQHDSRNPSRSESMDHCHSGGFTGVSSRSSSIRSYRSSSSGSTSTTTATNTKYKPRVRNPFHSHPSPTPQIQVSSSTTRHGNMGHHRSHKSTIWSFFRVGLVRTPERFELQDLKVRGNNNNSTGKSFGSRNSTSSTSSSVTNINNDKDPSNIINMKKKKQRFLDKNGGLFGGCKCSVNAVETVPSGIIIIKKDIVHEKEEKEQVMKKQGHGKQAISRHRTFEWLKELSFAGVPVES